MFLGRQMDKVPDIRVLADSALESAPDGLTYQLDFHPADGVVNRIHALRNGAGSNFGYDAEQILVALRDSNEAADLTDPVGLPLDDRQTGSDRLREMDVECASGNGGNLPEERGVTDRPLSLS